MQRMTLKGLMMLALCMATLASCGGGGSLEGGGTSQVNGPSQPTTAVVKIRTTGTLDPGAKIGGISVTGVLPAGVSVKATPDAYNQSILVTDSGIVIASGVTGTNAAAFATYNATDRKVTIQVYDQDGFDTGEFLTVHCGIDAGSTPTAASFNLEGFTATDLNGANINTLAPEFRVDLQ